MMNKHLPTALLGLTGFIAGRMIYRYYNRFNFENRVVLITGGSRGLGLNITRQLVAQGAHVLVCARDRDELLRAKHEFQRQSSFISIYECDIRDQQQVRNMINLILDQWGSIDVVFNNAGIIQAGPLENMHTSDYHDTMLTHFYGPLFVIEAVLPHMRKRKQGRIVNISSIGGRIAFPHLVPYSTSKFALVGYSLGLRSELAQHGIVVSTICPGFMMTGSPVNAWFKGQHRKEYAWFKIGSSIPGLSLSAETAAARIITACQYGDAFQVLGLPGRIADKAYSICPGLMADVLGLVNRLLPASGGIGQAQTQGRHSKSAWSESWLTTLTDQAALQNNEM